MRSLCIVVLLPLFTLAAAQGDSAARDEGLDKIRWLVGKWSGTGWTKDEAGNEVHTSSSVTGTYSLKDTYVSMYAQGYTGETSWTGQAHVTYDPTAELFRGYFLSDFSPGALIMSGTVDGNSLILTGSPDGVPDLNIRFVFERVSRNELKVTQSILEGEDWVSLGESTYKKT